MKYDLFLLVLLLPLAGCSAEKKPSAAAWKVLPEAPQPSSTLPAGTAPIDAIDPKLRAVQARDALFQALSSRLMQVVQSEGPAAAIAVCQAEAPGLAHQISQEHQVKIGRTSFKLRNPANQPPDWAAPFLKDKPEKPLFLQGPEGQTGAILPIRLQQQCLMCHGQPDQIPPAVLTVLQSRYPHDQATGFAEDELRGWFWVEVPASTTSQEP